MKFIRDIINDKRSAGATFDPVSSDATANIPSSETAIPERLSGTLYLSERADQPVEANGNPTEEGVDENSGDLEGAVEHSEDTAGPALSDAGADMNGAAEVGHANESDVPHVSERDMLPNWMEIDKESADLAEPECATDPTVSKDDDAGSPEETDDTSSDDDQKMADPIDSFPFIQKPKAQATAGSEIPAPAAETAPETIGQATAQENTQLPDSVAQVSAPSSLADARRGKGTESGQSLLAQLGAGPQMANTEAVAQTPMDMPAPAVGRGSSRSGRVKTRLLGFTRGTYDQADPFEKPQGTSSSTFPVAWLVVVSGPGRGASFTLHDGVAKIGRGEEQTVSLNFGDNSISRENHVAIAYDSEQNAFFIGHSGKSNLVRLNNTPLLSTEQVRSGDLIRLGETTLRFVALCGDDFSWDEATEKDVNHA